MPKNYELIVTRGEIQFYAIVSNFRITDAGTLYATKIAELDSSGFYHRCKSKQLVISGIYMLEEFEFSEFPEESEISVENEFPEFSE